MGDWRDLDAWCLPYPTTKQTDSGDRYDGMTLDIPAVSLSVIDSLSIYLTVKWGFMHPSLCNKFSHEQLA